MEQYELDDVRVFTNVVEAGSFTAAAKLLGMPKSTVSRRVGRLEDALGARLLHRTTRSLRLTDVGEIRTRERDPAAVVRGAGRAMQKS